MRIPHNMRIGILLQLPVSNPWVDKFNLIIYLYLVYDLLFTSPATL